MLASIIVTSYNYEAYIREAVASAQAQTYGNTEIVICDDGSTDQSVRVIRELAAGDPRIRCLAKANGGQASALNAAVSVAQGDLLCLLDADDVFHRDKVKQVVRLFQADPHIGMVVHPLARISAEGRLRGRIPQFGALRSGDLRPVVLQRAGCWGSVPASGVSLSRACAQAIFPIPEGPFRSEADGFIVTQAPLFGRVGVLADALTLYRDHGKNLTCGREVDWRWCRRGYDVNLRVYRALRATARRHHWPVAPPSANSALCEAALLGSVLKRSALPSRWRRGSRLVRCARGTDAKVLLRALILSAAGLMPARLSLALFRLVYLPNTIKTWLARAFLLSSVFCLLSSALW